MSAHDKSRKPASGSIGGAGRGRRQPPRDVADFYSRWLEFRDIAVDIARRADLSPLQRDTVNWLVLLVDRIGEQDVRAAGQTQIKKPAD